MAFSTGEGSEVIDLYDWMGHRCMKTIIDMANGAVTGLVLEDVPEEPSIQNWAPAYKTTHIRTAGTRPRRPARPMPVGSISRCKCGFIAADDDSRPS